MSNPEDETYSTIFTSLKHPVRRKILRMLSEGPRSFSEIQEAFKLESSHITYHLEGLGSLLFKTGDGKYALSSLGEGALSMMCHVEETHCTSPRSSTISRNWKVVFVVLLVGLILLSSLFYVQYQTLTHLSNQYLTLQEEQELLQNVLGEMLIPRNATLTYEYFKNGTAHEPYVMDGSSAAFETFWEWSDDWHSIYCLIDNSTLEMSISHPSADQSAYPQINMLGEVDVTSAGNCSVTTIDVTLEGNATPTTHTEWFMRSGTIESGNFSWLLPSKGWYRIWLEAPADRNATSDYSMNYTITLKLKSKGNYVPFFVRTQAPDPLTWKTVGGRFYIILRDVGNSDDLQ